MSGRVRVVIVSGVAGAGKTTVGEALAERLGWTFVEGDALHPSANVEKMERGEPLTDEDRAPWLAALRRRIDAHLAAGEPAVVASSALKRRYREALRVGDPRVLLVFLDAVPGLTARRLDARRGHFFDAGLLDSQYAALERPEEALVLDAVLPIAQLVDRIIERIGDRG